MGQIKIQPRSLGTHDGSFHADEVTACALLLVTKLIDLDKIKRTRDPEVLESCEFVCDVGGIFDSQTKRFDHHQAEYKGHLSSAGMVLQYLNEKKKLPPEEIKHLQNTFIAGVDAHDNGIDNTPPGVATYSQLITNFNPVEHEAKDEEQNAAFIEAVKFSLGHIQRLLARYRYIHSLKQFVEKSMAEGKDLLIFDKAMPWMDCFFELEGEKHPAQFVIMPSGTHWKLRGIPPSSQERMKVRKPLPQSWAGLLEEDLKKVTGIQGAIFCHKGRFFSLWQTKEDALKAYNFIAQRKHL